MEAEYDIEANVRHESVSEVKDLERISGETVADAGTAPTNNSWNANMQWLAGKLGVEQRGIERVPGDERSDTTMSQIGTIWLSSNMTISSFAIGALAEPVFHLGFVDTILIILFVNLLGIIPVCFFSTFGPRFGLRQMVLSRFFFGWHGAKLIAAFNILACLGWASVNVIVSAQLFNAVNPNMPGFAGIILIATATFIITIFGYKVVHVYERYAWIPCFIIYLIVIGVFTHSGHFVNIPMGVGLSEAGSALSFAAAIFGFATGWTSFAADYTVYQPVDRSSLPVFAWTFSGLAFPLLFTEMLGAVISTAMSANGGDNIYKLGYGSSGIGGLLAAVLVPTLGGFGRFCLVVLALSVIANNCPNIYSVSLTLQVLTNASQKVPRYVWTFVGTIIYCAIAIPGYKHFESALENIMLLVGYWLAIYEGIAISEHIFFKRGFSGYRAEDYLSREKLPPGFAAVLAFIFGAFGAVLGMAQVWFVGPVGKLCGGAFGGDVGFELAFAFSVISYCVMRHFEKQYFGR